ncbi:MAG: autotransporter-associated beta strand repeat-containing protein, partial [Planctomycetota bacterium]
MKTNWTRRWWERIYATVVWRRFRDRTMQRARRRSLRDWAKRAGLVQLESLEARAMLAADVSTDKFDYAPGSTALFQTFADGTPGHDFQIGEAVQFRVVRTDGLLDAAPGNLPWQVTDGVGGFAPFVNDSGVRIAPDLDGLADGKITTDWFVESQYANAPLEVVATGLSSGEVATEQFHDSAYAINDDTTLTSLASYTSADTITIASNKTLTLNLSSDQSFAGTIAGGGNLKKTGTGTLTLSGTNTYTGITSINAGTLSVGTIGNGGVAGNLGRATSAATNLVLGGGTLQFTGSAAASTDRNYTLT